MPHAGTHLSVNTPPGDELPTSSSREASPPPLETRAGGEPLGEYILLERIGRGGLGDVHRARHLAGQPAEVALKILRGGEEATPAEVRSFRREIDVARRLRHPGVLPILDVGEHAGQLFYTMPLIEGGSLQQRLRRRPMEVILAVRLIAKVACAMAYAHGRGVLHRDLKPANILLKDDEPLVADFGLARLVDHSSCHTVTGQIMGSVPYMSPEQAMGQSHRATPATDIWSLGVILYELLAGDRPFYGSTQTEVLRRIQQDRPRPPRELNPAIPPGLEAVCLRCLNKEPARRYRSMADLATDLERWLAAHETGLESTIAPEPPLAINPPWRRRAALLGLAGLLLLLALGLLPGKISSADEPTRMTQEESLRHRLARAPSGQSVTLFRAGSRRPWFRELFKEPGALVRLLSNRTLRIDTRGACLLEFLPPGTLDRPARFLVELRHIDSSAGAGVGLYACRQQTPRAPGRVVSLIALEHCEPLLRAALGEPVAKVPRQTLYSASVAAIGFDQPDSAVPSHTLRLPLGPTVPLSSPPAGQRDAAWHTLALEVYSGRVRLLGERGKPVDLTAASINRLFTRALDSQPRFKGLKLTVSPAGGFGLLLVDGAIEVRRVEITPLAHSSRRSP